MNEAYIHLDIKEAEKIQFDFCKGKIYQLYKFNGGSIRVVDCNTNKVIEESKLGFAFVATFNVSIDDDLSFALFEYNNFDIYKHILNIGNSIQQLLLKTNCKTVYCYSEEQYYYLNYIIQTCLICKPDLFISFEKLSIINLQES